MQLAELFKQKTVFSLEVFPPKKIFSNDWILQSLEDLASVQPDYISVTLGAGGQNFQRDETVRISDLIQNQLGITAVAHVPGIYKSKQNVLHLLDQLESDHVENILALRGDRLTGKKEVGDFKHANELISFIKKNRPHFSVAAACYPDCHSEATSFVDDITNLKRKVDAGTDHLITQLFFDNDSFYSFKEKVEIAGIHVPIEAGIMPCTNKKQIERITEITGVPLPLKFRAIMDRYEDNKIAMRDAGIAFAIDQIVDLVAHHVDGIHLYTMNNAAIAQRIWQATASLFAESKSRLQH
ncbi:MAG: methylenetetrahydrofolate reductase [NAD(P)H] [Lentilactobacillus hilgardii]|uniref:methylenetetrahydrofolate reductase [NAD(P)H] n=1 Tax=Lactobacillaceae TaxID=33958 RepID=UPI0010B44991|nr:5,10-methylenetetrahydrofolate reductase [Oenococcus sicerae]